jgi:hypothetical protein
MRTMPHFNVTNVNGETVDYATDVWQRKNVVLMAVPAGTDGQELSKRYAPLGSEDTRLVITSEPVAGITPPAVVVADQWGEIAHSAAVPAVADLPAPGELLSWLEHVRQRCPECEGEAR